jgi:hypothetical protein
MCLGNCYFATDKTPFISDKSPKAIYGYIIGSLKEQRCETSILVDDGTVEEKHRFAIKNGYFGLAEYLCQGIV